MCAMAEDLGSIKPGALVFLDEIVRQPAQFADTSVRVVGKYIIHNVHTRPSFIDS